MIGELQTKVSDITIAGTWTTSYLSSPMVQATETSGSATMASTSAWRPSYLIRAPSVAARNRGPSAGAHRDGEARHTDLGHPAALAAEKAERAGEPHHRAEALVDADPGAEQAAVARRRFAADE